MKTTDSFQFFSDIVRKTIETANVRSKSKSTRSCESGVEPRQPPATRPPVPGTRFRVPLSCPRRGGTVSARSHRVCPTVQAYSVQFRHCCIRLQIRQDTVRRSRGSFSNLQRRSTSKHRTGVSSDNYRREFLSSLCMRSFRPVPTRAVQTPEAGVRTRRLSRA